MSATKATSAVPPEEHKIALKNILANLATSLFYKHFDNLHNTENLENRSS